MARTIPAGSPVTGVARSPSGGVLAGATVTVVDANDDPAVVYADSQFSSVLDPVVTNGEGVFQFYASEGTYSLSVAGAQALEDVTVPGDADAPPGPILLTAPDLTVYQLGVANDGSLTTTEV